MDEPLVNDDTQVHLKLCVGVSSSQVVLTVLLAEVSRFRANLHQKTSEGDEST